MKDSVIHENIIVRAPISELNDVINEGKLVGSKINFNLLEKFGVFVLRNFFDKDYISELYLEYKKLLASGEIKRSEFHKTEVRFEDKHLFAKILENTNFLELADQFFGGKVGIDFMRIIKKDNSDRDPVFLHQDSGYQVGWYDAYSFFIPLTECGAENGGLALYPGTKNFGHLGDVGGIGKILPVDFPFVQEHLKPGDVLIMHAGTWHFSTPNISGEERVYLEVNFRAANDPAVKKLLNTSDKREWVLNIGVTDLFVSSREQRIKALYQEINLLKNQLAVTLNDVK